MEPNEADNPGWPTLFLAVLLACALVAIAAVGGAYALIPRAEAAVLLWWSLILAVSFGLLPRVRFTRYLAIALSAAIGLGLWIALGLFWTESDERTVIELTREIGFVGVVLGIGWSFAERAWRVAAAALACAAVIVCVVALTSRLGPGLLASPLHGTELLRRLSFPLNYWNALGCWAAMTVGFTLAWSAHAPRWPARGAALGGMCVAATVVYLTYSRAALVGVLLAVTIVIALSRNRWLAASHAGAAAAGTALVVAAIRSEPAIARGSSGDGGGVVAITVVLAVAACPLVALATSRAGLERLRTPRRIARRVLAAAGVVALFAAVAVGPTLASRAWDSFQRPTPPVTGDPIGRLGTLGGTRRALWQTALNSFADHPLHGTGAGTFEFVWNANPARTSFVRDAHSLYIESLGELGLPGALLVLTLLGTLLVGSVQATRHAPDATGVGAGAGIVAALAVFCVCAGVDWMWESTAVTTLALAAGALAATAGARAGGPLRLRRRIPVAVVLALALAIQLPVLASAVHVRTSQQAAVGGDMDTALASASTAVQIAPWEASGYLQRALLLEQLGLRRRAAADARRATAREPANWEHWLILARIEVEAGQVQQAIADVRHAAALNPRAAVFRSQPSSGRGRASAP